VAKAGQLMKSIETDSVFLKKNGAPLEDFQNVNKILAREAGLPISFENYYKFLVLLPLEADEKMEALKHYFGITQINELIARGIEIRRHDARNFIKEFQTEVLYTLFECKNSAEVLQRIRECSVVCYQDYRQSHDR
jgi:DNA polymerase elongation subunit (family B)